MIVEKPEQRSLKPNPLERPDYTEADLQAWRALNRGEATTHQQKLLLDHLVNFVCATYDIAFRTNQRETDLALGKQLVGQHIVYMLKTAPSSKGETERS